MFAINYNKPAIKEIQNPSMVADTLIEPVHMRCDSAAPRRRGRAMHLSGVATVFYIKIFIFVCMYAPHAHRTTNQGRGV